MRRFRQRFLASLAAALLLAPVAAEARCAGADLVARLEQMDPTAHAALLRRAHATPNGQGKFWRVSRSGVPDSWLFGTFHDTGIAREPLNPAAEAALADARVLLVESTPADQLRMQRRMASDASFIRDPAGNGVPAALEGAARDRAEARLAARGVTLEAAGQLRRWLLFSLVGVPVCMMRDAQAGAPTLDGKLAAMAVARGIPVAGLETYEVSLAALEAIPAEIMDAMLVSMLADATDEEDLRATVAALYRAGEIAAIWEFSQLSLAESEGAARSAELFEAVEVPLLAARNRAWMAVLLPELARGGVFAAFGALHLPGATGVVELLRAAGFTVTRADA